MRRIAVVAGRGRISLRAEGSSAPLPAPETSAQMFEQDTDVVVQLHAGATAPVCWTSAFDAAGTGRHDRVVFRARQR